MLFPIGFLAAVLFAPAPAGGQEKAPIYARMETWPASMLASRARYLDARRASEVTLGPWHATAPLEAGKLGEVRFPENGVDLEARGDDGKLLWKAHPEWVDGQVHGLPLRDWAFTYLYRTLHADRPGRFEAGLGSDDGLEVWLNEKKILSRDVARGPAPDQDRVVLDLQPGENRVLLKIHNHTGHHGFYFSLRRDPVLQLWERLAQDFPLECGWMMRDLPGRGHLAWFQDRGSARTDEALIRSVLAGLKTSGNHFLNRLENLCRTSPPPESPLWLDLYVETCRARDGLERIEKIDAGALRKAVENLVESFPDRYTRGAAYLERLGTIEKRLEEAKRTLERGEALSADSILSVADDYSALQAEALLANPLLDFDGMLLVKRRADSPKLGLPQNWQGNCSLPRSGFDDEIAVLSPVRPEGTLATLFKPEKPAFVGDVDLHSDADRMLFSSLGGHDRWQIFEIRASGTGLRQVTPGEHDDVDNYDACYLPDGRIIFASTRCFQGIPCVTGSDAVANLCIMDPDGRNIRQLCFDQDHNWCPTVLNNGRVLYTRWEYSDTPHYFSRLLFHMNPDGTGQMEYYGSNSFWPNSLFYARPIPGHPTRFAAIVSGHHGVPRMGELVLFDPSKGRHEADGALQRIPGFGKKVEPIIQDQLVDASWPKFLHPFPLSEKYFLAACKPAPDALWGVYLADVFDNLFCLCEAPGYALLEPIPFRKTARPPVIPDKVRPDRRDAAVYMADVYRGPGLDGIPRGTVKRLRVYEFHYCYNQMGGHQHVGVEGPWDVRRILGTVPVHDDGSAGFLVPANTPIAVQPLDASGRALQVMRSWFTAMPGEILSCVGCHERQNTVPPVIRTLAARRPPSAIEPWFGPARGFSFKREIQPVLDRYCVGCHDGRPRDGGMETLDFTAKLGNGWGNFTPSYLALHPFVRRPGPESDYGLQFPMEYHAGTSELVQMLEKGHHGVRLDEEAWDRLVTWIDLNVPDHGTWSEHRSIAADFHSRRIEMFTRHANRPEDPEAVIDPGGGAVAFIPPEDVVPNPAAALACPGWPFDQAEAERKRAAAGWPAACTLDLGEGATMDFVLVPAGEFVMGDPLGYLDEAPLTRVRIGEPFYMGRFEVTNAQYHRFDPDHDNGFFDQHHKDHTTPGYPAGGPGKPVIRVSFDRAMAFCQWLSEKTGRACTLPTEAEWEWACRGGTDTPFYYGDLDSDFSMHANLADLSIRLLAVQGVNPQPIPDPNPYQDFLPKDGRFDDGEKLMADVGRYRPNPFGLHDMHGNASEWTRSAYRPYPYREEDQGRASADEELRVARGGSWRDRPRRARSAFRLGYSPYQRVFHVGFRVVFKAREPEKLSRLDETEGHRQ